MGNFWPMGSLINFCQFGPEGWRGEAYIYIYIQLNI